MRFYSFFFFIFSNFWFILALFFSAASHVFYSIWRVYQCRYILKRKKNSVTLLCYIQCLFNIFCDTSAHGNDSFTELRSHALSKYAVCVIFHSHAEDTGFMDTFVRESRRPEKAEIL